MKIRIKENSLRLRLTKSEVETFAKTSTFSQQIAFAPDSQLTYTIEASADIKEPIGLFNGLEIKVLVPITLAKEWVNSKQVGFETQQLISEENYLKILVEKDFACLKPRAGEEESDNYPNPLS